MEPKTFDRFVPEQTSEDELFDGERLNELEAEDLIGHHIALDENDDWPALDL